jgi:hypothetical protein
MPKSESSNQQTCRLIWNQKVRLPMISLPTYKSSYQVVQICDIRPFQSQVCLTLNGARTPIKERESSSNSTQRFQMKTELNSLIHSSCINRQRHTLNCGWGETTKTYHETLHKSVVDTDPASQVTPNDPRTAAMVVRAYNYLDLDCTSKIQVFETKLHINGTFAHHHTCIKFAGKPSSFLFRTPPPTFVLKPNLNRIS